MCTFVRNFVLAVLSTSPYSINAGGELLSLEEPVVMGILNATPDSFYKHEEGAEALAHHALQMLEEGASILDVGACSTRPGFTPPDEEEEMRRLKEALSALRKVAPKAILSVDTFRASVAKMCVEGFGVQMVNDISGGELDKEMFKTVAELGVPYILTHNANLDETEDAPFMAALLREMGGKVEALHELGVCDIILDPGFGFGKTLEQNYALMSQLECLQVMELPILVGVSRKSMIYRLLDITPDDSLNGTTVLHTIALMKGASILRVHDVRPAVECVRIHNMSISKP